MTLPSVAAPNVSPTTAWLHAGPARCRRACALLAAAVLLLTRGTGPGAPAVAVAEPVGQLRIGLPRLPVRLDPVTSTLGPERMVFQQVFQGLVTLGALGEPEPGLAVSWSVARDGLTWVFRLRPDVRFHDGTGLTPDIVVASLARQLTPPAGALGSAEPAAAWAPMFRGPSAVVREVRAGDDGTVQIQLKTPFSPLLALLAHPALAIALPQNGAAVPFLGTGPYRVVEQGQGRLRLEAAPTFGGDPPRTPRLVFVEVPDDAAGIGGLGPADLLDVYFPQAPPAWTAIGLQVVSGPTWHLGLLALRTDEGLMTQRAARRAVARALDLGSLQAALGSWAVSWQTLLPPGAWAAQEQGRPVGPPDQPPPPRQRADGRGEDPALTLLVPESRDGPDLVRVAEAIRAAEASAGIRIAIRVESGDAHLRALRQGEGALALQEVALDAIDPHFALRPLLASDAAVRGIATNVAFYRNPIIDGMLHRASQLAFRQERLRLYHRLQAHVADDVPYVPLYARLQWALARPRVRDLRLDPGRGHRLDRAWMDASASPAPDARPAGPLPPQDVGR